MERLRRDCQELMPDTEWPKNRCFELQSQVNLRIVTCSTTPAGKPIRGSISVGKEAFEDSSKIRVYMYSQVLLDDFC